MPNLWLIVVLSLPAGDRSSAVNYTGYLRALSHGYLAFTAAGENLRSIAIGIVLDEQNINFFWVLGDTCFLQAERSNGGDAGDSFLFQTLFSSTVHRM